MAQTNPNPKFRPPSKPGNTFLYVLIFALLLIITFYAFSPDENATGEAEEVPITQLVNQYQQQQLSEVEVKGDKIYGTLLDSEDRILSQFPPGNTLEELGFDLSNDQIPINITKENTVFWINLLSNLAPIILFIAIFFFVAKQLGRGANSAFSFGKSQARIYSKDTKKKTTFKDVAGMDESKEELVEVVDFLKNPKKYTKIGAKIPRGVILAGAPGTGKTLLARAVAGEAEVPFFSISGSEFVEMFVGVGASRVRDLFQKAKQNAPCIIFIDEIDAVGRQRGFGMGGGHDEREQTLNQILTEMDGFENDTNVIVMAATNRPDVLDAALMRPGRFDRRVIIDMPNLKEREEILKVHVRNKPLAKKTDLTVIARQTPGFSGADLENLLNEAAILAAKKDQKEIVQKDLEEAVEKIGLGAEKKSRKMSDEEKEITAYHEVGHALVRKLCKKCDPVHKVSIIPRGMALGVTWFLPETEKHMTSISKFQDELCSILGGHVAEEIFFGEVTTGASNDLQKATEIARKMVTKFGMSDLGPIIYGESNGGRFLGADLGGKPNYSQATAARIDEEVAKILKNAEKRTFKIITDNKSLMHEISKALLKKETLNKDQFDGFFEDKKKSSSKKASAKK